MVRRLTSLLFLALLIESARTVAGEAGLACKPLEDAITEVRLPPEEPAPDAADAQGAEEAEDAVRALRHAIRERRPLHELVAIPRGEQVSPDDAPELLSAAVDYPEALNWLLALGINPNAVDATGHTPLMYAARFDRIDAVDMLIANGADVNAVAAATPECFDSISLQSATALHFAARYAGVAVVRHLLDAGAFTFLQANDQSGTARDWLRRFGNDDRSKPLDKADIAFLESALMPANDAARARISAALGQRAMRLYESQLFEAAHIAMRDALRAWPPGTSSARRNQALADFSLIALRAGHALDSANASRRVIEQSSDPKLRAAAWFNTGLACEADALAVQDRAPVYCSSHAILEFLGAWREFPTKDRERKILAVLDDMAPGCTYEVYPGRTEDYFLVQANTDAPTLTESPQRVVVRHARGAPPPADAIEYSLARDTGVGPATRRTAFIESYDFTGVSVSVLRGLGEIRGTAQIRGQDCTFD